MKVVADSMIWVSYFLHPNSFRCRIVEEALSQQVRFFVSDYLVEEVVKSVIARLEEGSRYGVRIRRRLNRQTRIVKLPEVIPRHVPGDPGDDPIVETAIRASANYLVSADKEVLKLKQKKIGNLKIITAVEFARLLRWSPK